MPMTTRGGGKNPGKWTHLAPKTKTKGHVKTKRSAKGKVVATADKVLTQAIKKVMRRNEETHYKAQIVPGCDPSASGYSNWNSPISTADAYSCIPDISMGADTSIARIGNQITPTKLRVDWNFSLAAGDAYSRDMEVHLFLLTSKQVKGISVAGGGQAMFTQPSGVPGTPTNLTHYFLDSGLGGEATFDGTYFTSRMPIYTDRFTLLKHKVIRLRKPVGQTGYNSSSSGLTSIAGVQYEKHFSYTFKKLPKFKYDEGGGQPNNFAPFWMVGYRNVNGSPDNTGGNLVVSCRSHLYWKDD